MTLLVVPATDLHSLADRSSELVDWLVERREAGDAIAQCGFTGSCASHRAGRGHRGEFAGLDAGETRRAVDAGWRVLRLAGVEPAGFVAPGYGYTRPLHAALARRFSWWLDARRIQHPRAPAGGAPLAPVVSPSGWQADPRRTAVLRRRAALRAPLLRVDLHPEELRPRQVRGLDELLGRAAGRKAVTAPELAARVVGARGIVARARAPQRRDFSLTLIA